MNTKTDTKPQTQSSSSRSEKSASGLTAKTSVKLGYIRRVGLTGIGG